MPLCWSRLTLPPTADADTGGGADAATATPDASLPSDRGTAVDGATVTLLDESAAVLPDTPRDCDVDGLTAGTPEADDAAGEGNTAATT